MVFSAAADHGADIARSDLQGNQRALRLRQSLGILAALRKICGDGLFGLFLHIQVQCSIDLQAFLVNRIGIILIGQCLDDIVDEIRCRAVCSAGGLRLGQLEICCLGLPGFRFRNVSVLCHLIQDNALAVLGSLYAAERRIVIRAVRQPCQQGTLCQIQILYILSEINPGCGLDAVGALAEINLIHVHFQDLLLRIFAFDFKSQHNLQKFALQSLLLGQECIPGQLLGNGGAALSGRIVGNHIVPDCTENAPRVHAVMFIETHILGGHESILQILRNLRNGNRDTVFLRMDRGDQPSLGIIDLRGCTGRHIGRYIRKASRYGHHKSCGRTCSCYKKNHHEKHKNLFHKRFLRFFSVNLGIFHDTSPAGNHLIYYFHYIIGRKGQNK